MGKRVADMTPEQRERKRQYQREYDRNLTPEQRERRREYHRNLTPEQIERKREYARIGFLAKKAAKT